MKEFIELCFSLRMADELIMGCRRCQGLMVPDLIDDLPEEWGLRGVSAWRCVVCGDIIDPVIVANRESRLSLENGSKWSRLKFAGLSKKAKA